MVPMSTFGRASQWLMRRSGTTYCWSIVALTACSVSAALVTTSTTTTDINTGADPKLLSLMASTRSTHRGPSVSTGSWLWNPNRNHRVQCEALTSRAADETSDNRHESSSSSSSMLEKLADSDMYMEMKVPDRALESSHVIYGQLLKENLIESYTAYKLSTVTSETTGGDVIIASVKLGGALDGHPNVVHGGILALLIDDILGFGYEALRVPAAVTANLNVNYRAAVPAGSLIIVSATLVERKARKLTWSVRVESPDQQTLYCEATSVFVIPREAYAKILDSKGANQEAATGS
jgi:acyl-coenzyme A thioesterase PaaI-like protein